MICKNCGKEISDNAKFCPECGEKMNAANYKNIIEEINEAKMNPFCIAGVILAALMFFFNYQGLVGYAAVIVSAIGFWQAKENSQKGLMLAVVSMVIAGVFSFIHIKAVIDYNNYVAEQEAVAEGLLNWLGSFFQ